MIGITIWIICLLITLIIGIIYVVGEKTKDTQLTQFTNSSCNNYSDYNTNFEIRGFDIIMGSMKGIIEPRCLQFRDRNINIQINNTYIGRTNTINKIFDGEMVNIVEIMDCNNNVLYNIKKENNGNIKIYINNNNNFKYFSNKTDMMYDFDIFDVNYNVVGNFSYVNLDRMFVYFIQMKIHIDPLLIIALSQLVLSPDFGKMCRSKPIFSAYIVIIVSSTILVIELIGILLVIFNINKRKKYGKNLYLV